MLNPQQIKADFPIFKNQPGLIYLDSTATSLKPQPVIDKENEYYQKYSANIFRGIYKISETATSQYENSREKIAHFIGAKDSREIIFTRNATEAINLIATSWGSTTIDNESEIITSIMEHHANFVPWQILCNQTGARFRVAEITSEGLFNSDQLINLVTAKTKLVALTHISNVLGTINPIADLVNEIKHKNPRCLVLIDGAQAVPHMAVNVQELGCDFYVFSSHKMLGPTGVGVLWGRYTLLHAMQPYQYGGEMIQAVYVDHTEFKDTPHKFEAGTPHIAGVIGLGAAVDYLEALGMDKIRKHEQEIVSYGLEKLVNIEGITVIGPKNSSIRAGIITFTIDKIHAHDIAQVLDSNNICIRSGHHCAMPLHLQLKIPSTARASFYVYTTKEDIDALVQGLKKAQQLFS